jgi:hypothetical protein
LLRDRDAPHGSEFCNRIETVGIMEVSAAPRSPRQNANVERVIGSIRRENLGHLTIFNERHLRGVLSWYVDYYQRTRTALSLDKDRPDSRSIIPMQDWKGDRHPASLAACISITNVSPPGSSRILAHQSMRRGQCSAA